MTRVIPARLFSLAVLSVFAACSGSGSSTSAIKTGGNFVVLKTEPANNGQLFLNDPIRIDFSTDVDLNSVDLTTFTFQVFDQLGAVVQENVAGNFRLARSAGDAVVGRRLEFVPRFPTNDTFDNGGFKPGRTYLIQLVGGNRVNGTVLRDATGRSLLQPQSFQFHTAEGSTPAQLFRNTVPGGPRRTTLNITPTPDSTGVVLNKFGAPPVELRLVFDQPLNPSSANLPVLLDTNPLVRSSGNRGRIFLEYDDPIHGPNRWIPADVELEANQLDSATVLVRPVGVLPNNAVIRVIVESSMADISGESNVSNAAYNRIFGTFPTKRSYEQQFDAVVERFLDSSNVDLGAAFGEPLADVGPGYVKAGFAFEGTSTNLELEPTVQEVVLNTNFTMVTPKQGSPYNVSGGVFNFKNVKIPQGVTVRGQGTNPMVLLVSGTVEVAGTLSVRGGNGQRGTQIASANFAKTGGYGACAGGTGGAGSPSTTLRDNIGGTGNGPLEAPLRGGRGGNLACVAGCNRGSGGGGGALSTQGDPNYPAKTVPTGGLTTTPTNAQPIFIQQRGDGGQGCLGNGGSPSRLLEGGTSAAGVFVDSRSDNNFWGSAINFQRSLRITGELSVPVGGGGGGGGGDLSYNNSCTPEDPNFNNDSTGGGGGGGGGVLIVKALSDIIITESGTVTADGGSGGAGEVNGSSSKGGGGGAGAGGMVILMSATRIEIHAHGDRYANRDYSFAVSADGGVCTTGTFSTPIVSNKYPANGVAIGSTGFNFERNYDGAPLGGFGGMGVVQLMAPPGTNTDGTNTVLDDNIRVFRLGLEQTGTGKTQILAWRGYPNTSGVLVDDFNIATNIGDNEGDIRPSPILMPTPFAALTRIRSKWIDTGASVRRSLTSDDNLPRGILDPNGTDAGPRYSFAGVNTTTGYANYETVGELARTTFPAIGTPTAILSQDANETFLGKPAYRVELATATLGSVVDFYVQNSAELRDASGSVIGSFPILSHTSRVLWLSTEGGALPTGATTVQLRAKLFKIMTNGLEGLGQTYPGSTASTRVPNSNVRIGFAFHQDPANLAATRYPAAAGTYEYNLADAGVQQAIRMLGAGYVQYDILFDSTYKHVPTDQPPALNPQTPRCELHFLRLPFQF